jgi:hypothetical protein
MNNTMTEARVFITQRILKMKDTQQRKHILNTLHDI